jgi:hypothetical protein
MTYIQLEKPIHIANIDYEGEPYSLNVCSVILNGNGYEICHIVNDHSIDNTISIKPIIRRDSFIKRIGTGLLKLEDGVVKLFLITGETLYGNNYEYYREIINSLKFQTITIRDKSDFYYKINGNFCFLSEDLQGSDLENVILNLGFMKIQGLLDQLNFSNINPYKYFLIALKAIVKEFGTKGYINSMWAIHSYVVQNTPRSYSTNYDHLAFCIEPINKELLDRIIWLYDSKWFVWESQHIYEYNFSGDIKFGGLNNP